MNWWLVAASVFFAWAGLGVRSYGDWVADPERDVCRLVAVALIIASAWCFRLA